MIGLRECCRACQSDLSSARFWRGRKVLITNRHAHSPRFIGNSQRQWFRIFETLAIATSFGQRLASKQSPLKREQVLPHPGSWLSSRASSRRDWVGAAQALVQRQVCDSGGDRYRPGPMSRRRKFGIARGDRRGSLPDRYSW